jgi:menaquinone-dependent protoporphyrinogen IX oxidase
VKHIYERNANMKDLVKDDSLMVSNRYFATDLEKGIESIRDEWRQKNEIAENATVIFFAPGNEHNEAEFATENVRRGVKEFLMKYSAPTSLSPKALPINNFVTVISLHSGSDGEKYVREYLKENEWYGKVIFVSN